MLYSVQRGEELLDKEKVTKKEGAYPHGIYIYVYTLNIYICRSKSHTLIEDMFSRSYLLDINRYRSA